jgi:hypothetical protein
MLFRDILTLEAGKRTYAKIWDILLFMKKTFPASEDINIINDKTLVLASPKFDGQLRIDGEGYIL